MSNDLKHYVYALMDPRDEVIFYIGKGLGARANAHLIEAAFPEAENLKVKRIREIHESGDKVRTLVLARDYEWADEAFAIESLCIMQARITGTVMGISCYLTNIARGHHEDRFRLWDHPGELSGFEYKKPQNSSSETYLRCQPMYDHIIQTVPEFKQPLRNSGMFINSQKRPNGFAFVVFPKQGKNIHFEYIGRKEGDVEQIDHALKLQEIIEVSRKFDHAKVNVSRTHLSVEDHEAVASALREFINDIDQAEATLK